MNFYDKRVRRIISIIIIVLVVAMVLTMVLPYIAYEQAGVSEGVGKQEKKEQTVRAEKKSGTE